MLLKCCLSNFEMVPVTPIITVFHFYFYCYYLRSFALSSSYDFCMLLEPRNFSLFVHMIQAVLYFGFAEELPQL